jgi:hypothetical protein
MFSVVQCSTSYGPRPSKVSAVPVWSMSARYSLYGMYFCPNRMLPAAGRQGGMWPPAGAPEGDAPGMQTITSMGVAYTGRLTLWDMIQGG